jgi:hypothetical protein
VVQKTHKLDIFRVLDQTSRKNINFYKDLTKEEQNAFQPLVVTRWLTGTTDPRQIYFLNELVNPFTFAFAKHKELLYNLMTMCTSGKPQRYYWNKTTSKKNTKKPMVVGVIKDYFHYNTLHAIQALPLLTNEDILDYATQLGRQKEDITKIKKELRTP